MDAVGKKVESQVQFWTLLGPFLVLLSIAVLLFKVSIHWYFPVSALIGIPLCVKWKMKGMAIALCTLLLLSGIGYQNLELNDRYWHVGLALTMAFSFIVMTLSLEEVQGLVAKVQLESQSRLDNFVLLDEKLKTLELGWASEREQLRAEAATLSSEMVRSQEEKLTTHKLAQLATEELVLIKGQHDLLIQDLHYKKKQIAQLQERLEESELSLQNFINTDSEKQIVTLTDQLTCLEREREVLQAKISVALNEGQSLKNKLSFLEEEREAQIQARASLQQQCDQMRVMETQQRQLLQQAQQKIHEMKIQLMEDESQKELLQKKEKEFHEELQRMEEYRLLNEDKYQSALEEAKNETLKLDQQLKQSLTELEAREKALQTIQLQADQLTCKASELEIKAQQSIEQLLQTQNQKIELEEVLQKTQAGLQEAEEKLEVIKQKRDQLPYSPGNTRHIESMFLQLKSQFNDKCKVLDETRRELFHVNEQLLKLQKEREEENIYGMSDLEQALQKEFIQLGKQFDKLEKNTQQEIDHLSELISQQFS